MKKALVKYLKSLSDQELVKEIQKLYSHLDSVKQYYESEFRDNYEQVAAGVIAQIDTEHYTPSGFSKSKSSISKKIIADFENIAANQIDAIKSLLRKVEMMIDFSSEYGDIDESFYNSLGSNYEEVCQLIQKEKLQSQYEEYCQKLVYNSRQLGMAAYRRLFASFEKCFN